MPLPRVDPFAEHHLHRKRVVRSATVDVTDGRLIVVLHPIANFPATCGIEVIPATGEPSHERPIS
jgi:hypothetical protein